jgi:hypothetical protein
MVLEQNPSESNVKVSFCSVSTLIWCVLIGILLCSFGYYFLQASKDSLLGLVFIFLGGILLVAGGLYRMFVSLTTVRVRTISNDPKEILSMAKKFSRKAPFIYGILAIVLASLSFLEGTRCDSNAWICITTSGLLLYLFLFPAAPFVDEFFDPYSIARFLYPQDPYGRNVVIDMISNSNLVIALILNSLLVYFAIRFFVLRRAKKRIEKLSEENQLQEVHQVNG